MTQTYTTTDTSAAAWLHSQGCRLLRCIPGSWVVFQFDDADGTATRLINEWNLGEPVGKVKAYSASLQTLRRAIRHAA